MKLGPDSDRQLILGLRLRLWCFPVLLVILLSLSSPALARRIKVTAVNSGKPLHGAEVCLYPALSAEPLVGLRAREIRCLPTDMILDIPPRTYGFYVQQGDRFVTTHHQLMTGTANLAGAETLVNAELSVGAHLDVSQLGRLKSNESLSLIIGGTKDNRATALPLNVVGGRALVPAAVPIVPVLMRDGVPVWLGETLRLEPNAVHTINMAAPSGRPTSLLVWFRADDPDLLMKEEMPKVELLDSKGRTHTPEFSAHSPGQLLDSIYVFRGAATGPAVVRAIGPRLLPSRVSISLAVGQPSIAEPLALGVGAQLVVTVRQEDASFVPSPSECEKADRPESDHSEKESGKPQNGRRIGLWKCQGPLSTTRLRPDLLPRCTEVRYFDAGPEAAGTSFDGLPVGEHLVTLSRAKRIVEMVPVTLTRGETSSMEMTGLETVVSGRVTRGGRPVVALVRFATGSAVSNVNTGEYVALLSALPGRNTVQVIACDDSFAFVYKPLTDISNGAGNDIDVPVNELVVQVRDRATNERLKAATVTVAVVAAKDKPDDVLFLRPSWPRDDQLVIDSLEKGAFVRACAALDGYEHGCSDVRVIARESEAATVLLNRQPRHGRIVGDGYEHLFWVRPDGTVAERVRVAADGRFTFKLDHPNEHLVAVGTAPMFASRDSTLSPDGSLNVTPPPPTSTRREIRFILSPSHPQAKAVLAFWINGLRVPIEAFSTHQRQRRLQWYVSKEAPLQVRDFFAGDVVAISVGPDMDMITTSLQDPAIFAGRAPAVVASPEYVIE